MTETAAHTLIFTPGNSHDGERESTEDLEKNRKGRIRKLNFPFGVILSV